MRAEIVRAYRCGGSTGFAGGSADRISLSLTVAKRSLPRSRRAVKRAGEAESAALPARQVVDADAHQATEPPGKVLGHLTQIGGMQVEGRACCGDGYG
jgi:hypothetical protein